MCRSEPAGGGRERGASANIVPNARYIVEPVYDRESKLSSRDLNLE